MQQLSFASGTQRSRSFQFEQHAIFDQQVCPEFADLVAAEPDRQRYLPIRINSCLIKRDHQRFLVDAFQKPVTEFIVNIVEDADDFLGNLAVFECCVGAHTVNRTVITRLDQ